MKKSLSTLSLVLALVMLLGVFAACTATEESPKATTAPVTTVTTTVTTTTKPTTTTTKPTTTTAPVTEAPATDAEAPAKNCKSSAAVSALVMLVAFGAAGVAMKKGKKD